jgi:hypothetical protein
MTKQITITRSEAEPIAQRIVNAELHMVGLLMELADISKADAQKAFVTLRKAKALKLDAVIGRYMVKHGAFLNPDAIRRAVAL